MRTSKDMQYRKPTSTRPAIRIPMMMNRHGDSLTTHHTLRLRPSIITRFGIGSIGVGQEARKYMNGPLIPGPWAYTFGLSTILDNHGGSGRESTDALAAGTEHMVDDGDLLEIDGHTYRIRVIRDKHIALDAVAD